MAVVSIAFSFFAPLQNGIRFSDRRQVDLMCDVVAPSWEAAFPHRCVDLSTQGLWLETSFPLPLGEDVVIGLMPPGCRLGELLIFARVVRRSPPGRGKRRGMGLRFLDLLPYEREELARFLRQAPTAPKVHWSQLAARLVAA